MNPSVTAEPAKWSISKRWTPALVEDGFTPVSTTFLEHYAGLRITPAEAIFIIHLMSFKWNKKHPFPRVSLIAKRMNMSETAVRGHARSLENKGFLKRITRPGRSNQFDLTPLFRALEQAQALAALEKEIDNPSAVVQLVEQLDE